MPVTYMPLYVALKDGENCFIKIDSAINKQTIVRLGRMDYFKSIMFYRRYIYIYMGSEKERFFVFTYNNIILNIAKLGWI